ncbi:hypothetical protein JCM18916_1571 [Cutibacterium acnes JCM 18916]|nr:hypothetical protein JCM18916_1571 [Cutibacterium acnes JCM 18916]
MGGICNNQQVPRNPRAGVKDMLLSLAIILVPVMLIVWFFTRTLMSQISSRSTGSQWWRRRDPVRDTRCWLPRRFRRFGGRPRPAMPTRGIAG